MQIEMHGVGAPTGGRLSWRDARNECGPFDIIGDPHGCADELEQLLIALGYEIAWSTRSGVRHAEVRPPAGRKVVFLGDLVDRGPNVPEVLRIAMSAVAADCGYCVRGNHEQKLERWLAGRRVTVSHGLAQTIEQIQREGSDACGHFADFLRSLPSYIWLDGGRLIVSHAGPPRWYRKVDERMKFGDRLPRGGRGR